MQTLLFSLPSVPAALCVPTAEAQSGTRELVLKLPVTRPSLASFEQQCAWADEWIEEMEREDVAA